MKTAYTLLIAYICSAIILLSPYTLSATSYTWNGTTGNWSDPSKWIPNGVPGTGDQATINGGT